MMDNAKSDKGNRGRKGVQTSKPRLSQIFWSRYKIEQESRTQPAEPRSIDTICNPNPSATRISSDLGRQLPVICFIISPASHWRRTFAICKSTQQSHALVWIVCFRQPRSSILGPPSFILRDRGSTIIQSKLCLWPFSAWLPTAVGQLNVWISPNFVHSLPLL